MLLLLVEIVILIEKIHWSKIFSKRKRLLDLTTSTTLCSLLFQSNAWILLQVSPCVRNWFWRQFSWDPCPAVFRLLPPHSSPTPRQKPCWWPHPSCLYPLPSPEQWVSTPPVFPLLSPSSPRCPGATRKENAPVKMLWVSHHLQARS